MKTFDHISVLASEVEAFLCVAPLKYALDCTGGGGGHTALLLKYRAPDGVVITLDRDPEAIAWLQHRFQDQISKRQLMLFHTPFSSLEPIVRELGIAGRIGAVIADLGVSTHQISTDYRGFSFLREGPLDMRMEQNDKNLPASSVIASASEKELADIFYFYGEEKKSRAIAKRIVKERIIKPFLTTTDLAECIARHFSSPGRMKIHPATRVFQALRIYVNRELEELKSLLATVPGLLQPQGRFGVISFHSLEDRLVKQSFVERSRASSKNFLPREIPISEDNLGEPVGKIIRPFPIIPSSEEEKMNPKSRSAKLRILEAI